MRPKSIAYFKARSLRYKLLTSLVYSSTLICLIYISLPVTHWLKDEIFPKLPIGRSLRSSILIELPSEPLPQSIHDHPEQVFAYQSQPRLALIGIGKKIHSDTSPATLELGLFPPYQEKILRVDSQAEFYFDAPSLTLLVQKLRFGEKGKKLKALLIKAQVDLQNSMHRILPLLKKTLSKYLDEIDVDRLLRDPYIITALQSALISEVSQRVTLTQLKQNLSKLPELEQLLTIASGELSSSKLSQKALLGLFDGSRVAYKNTSQEVKDLWSDDLLLKDSFSCLLQTLKQQGTWSVSILSKVLKGSNSRLCKQLKRSLNGMVISSLKEGAKEFSSQAWDNLYREQDSVLNLGRSAAKKVGNELQIKPILNGFWRNLKTQEDLQNYVITNYGQKNWRKLQKALIAMSNSPELASELNRLSKSLESSLESFFSLILLNDSGDGPNPLLVTMIQEKLSGIKRTVVWIRPGNSLQRVGSGHRLKSGR